MHSHQSVSVLKTEIIKSSPYSLSPIEWVQFAEHKVVTSETAAEVRMEASEVAVSGLINGMRNHWQRHQLTAGAKLTETEAEQLLNADIKLYGEDKYL